MQCNLLNKVRIHLLIRTLHSVPSSCTLCQLVLMVSTSDIKYKFGVPFNVLTNQVVLYTICDLSMCTNSRNGGTFFSYSPSLLAPESWSATRRPHQGLTRNEFFALISKSLHDPDLSIVDMSICC